MNIIKYLIYGRAFSFRTPLKLDYELFPIYHIIRINKEIQSKGTNLRMREVIAKNT